MNWDTVEGQWKQLTGTIKAQWGKLSDDEITRIDGNREKLVGTLQEQYGLAKDEAERQVDAWAARH